MWAWAELDEWSKLSILPFQEPELTGNRKSQLAIEYGYRVREKSNTWVFWVHAGSAARFEQGYRLIAEQAKIPGWDQKDADILGLVHRWLSDERNGP